MLKEEKEEALHTAERQIHEPKESVMAELEEQQAENETLQVTGIPSTWFDLMHQNFFQLSNEC